MRMFRHQFFPNLAKGVTKFNTTLGRKPIILFEQSASGVPSVELHVTLDRGRRFE
jgi:hypothetical protein